MTDFRRTQSTFGDAFPTDEQLEGGFSFDNVRRNELLLGQPGAGAQKIKAMKTGTTIVGVVYKVRASEDPSVWLVIGVRMADSWSCVAQDGVVLGADTRSTGGSIVRLLDMEVVSELITVG